MICSRCNSKIPDDCEYCPKCELHYPSLKRGKRTADVEFIDKAFFTTKNDFHKNYIEKETGELILKDTIDAQQKADISEDSNVINWLWIIYPFFLILLYYINEGFDFGGSGIASSMGRVFGGIFFYLLFPLLVIVIRRIFTKKQLSEKAKIILFYGVSFTIFSLSTCGKLLQNIRTY